MNGEGGGEEEEEEEGIEMGLAGREGKSSQYLGFRNSSRSTTRIQASMSQTSSSLLLTTKL